MFDVDTTKAESLSKEIFNYIATPETEYNADTVFKEKMKAIIGDSALGPLGEGVMLLGKLFKGLKKQPEVVEELNNSINLSGGSAMNPEGPLAKEIDEGTFSYKAELEGPEKFDTVMIMDSIEPVIIGTGKNNKVKVEDIINHFDQAPKLDIKNPDDFKLMVDQGVKEVTYQLDQKITGAGWYDQDIKIAMEKLDDINPKFKGNDQIKDMVVFFTAIAKSSIGHGMWKVFDQNIYKLHKIPYDLRSGSVVSEGKGGNLTFEDYLSKSNLYSKYLSDRNKHLVDNFKDLDHLDLNDKDRKKYNKYLKFIKLIGANLTGNVGTM